jgi:hypothetical protein
VPAILRLHIIEGGGIVSAEPNVVGVSLVTARPNPFRQGTEISWSRSAPGRSELSIFDVGGRLVREFVEEFRSSIQWDGRDSSGRSVPNGVYFYRLSQGTSSTTGKLVRMR